MYDVEELAKKLKEYIDSMRQEDVIELWNNYCEKNKYDSSMLFPMCDFDDLYKDTSPLQLAKLVRKSGFDPQHAYFRETGNGEVRSYATTKECLEDLVDIPAIVNYIIDNDDWLYNDTVWDILTDFKYPALARVRR